MMIATIREALKQYQNQMCSMHQSIIIILAYVLKAVTTSSINDLVPSPSMEGERVSAHELRVI